MNKLEEIRQRATETMVSTRNNSWSILDNLLNDVFYLLGQVEERDKALQHVVDTFNDRKTSDYAAVNEMANIARKSLRGE